MGSKNGLSLDRVYQASFALKDVARKTDLIYSPHFSNGNEVYLKTENLQVTGSFKLRGAYFKISRLSEEEKAAGIIACSAGNHAQGVALASTHRGAKSIICMPDGAPISKVEATKALGAEVRLVKGTYDDAYTYACKLRDETGATFIHPFDDPDVIAGQGTIGLEILDQLPDVDAIVVPVGGGGLISGVAYAVKKLKPNVKIYGVQAKEAASMADSLKYDEQVTLSTVSTAAMMFGKIPVEGKKVVCLVSGGNIDVNILSRVITRGLVTSGRNATLQIALEDKPGQLVDVATIIAGCGANVTGVHYGHSDPDTAVTSCVLTLEIETRDFAQLEEVRQTLSDKGFKLI